MTREKIMSENKKNKVRTLKFEEKCKKSLVIDGNLNNH